MGTSNGGTTTNTVQIYNHTTIGSTSSDGTSHNDRTLTVHGNTTIGHEKKTKVFKVYGTANITGATEIGGITTIKNSLTVGVADKSHSLTVNGTVGTTGAVSIGGSLEVTNATLLKNTLTVNSTSNLQNQVVIGVAKTSSDTDELLYVKGTAKVTGNSTLLGNLIVGTSTGADNASATAQIYNNVTIGSTTVSGTSVAHNNRSLTVHGNTTIGHEKKEKELKVYGVVNITGKTTVGGDLEVASKTILSGDMEIGTSQKNPLNTLIIHSTIEGKEKAQFNKNVIIGPDVTGASTSGSYSLNIHNATTIGEYTSSTDYEDRALTVYGTTTIGHTSRNKNLTVNGNATITKTLDVDGSATIGSSRYTAGSDDKLTVNANTTMGGTLSVAKATTLSDTLTVTKATTIGTTSAQADLTVNGDVHITGADLYLGTGTTAATRVQMTYTAGSSGDTLTITFND